MADESKKSQERIRELEQELQSKENELAQVRLRLSVANTQLEKVIDQISHEIRMAAKIQKLLSPTELPHIQGFDFSSKFQPGMKSGGDYFDVFEHEDRLRFGVVLASSSGYTMSALFLGVLIKMSTKIEARRGMNPEDMVAAIAKEMAPEMKSDDKVSLFYGILDRRSYEFKYCLAGVMAGYQQVPGRDALVTLEPTAPVITKDFNTKPQSLSLTLNSKDRLVLCSEGIFGAKNAEGRTWGTDALRDAVRAAPKAGVHDLRNEILFRCESHSGKADPDRDQTVLVWEVKDRVIKLA